MSLNNLDCLILNEVMKGNMVLIHELAEKYNMSERNIRYKIDNINYYLSKNKLPVMVNNNKGEIFFENTKKHFFSISTQIISDSDYIFSKEERERLVIVSILLKTDIFTISEINEDLDVSVSTIKKDMKDIKDILAENNIEIIKVAKKGLLIEGDEDNIRTLLLSILLENNMESSIVENEEKIDVFKRKLKEILDKNMEKDSEKSILEYLEKINKIFSINFTDDMYNYIFNYLKIMVYRLKNNKSLKENLDNLLYLKKFEEYQVIQSYLSIIENRNDLKISMNETLKILEIYMENKNFNVDNSWKEVKKIVEEIIQSISMKTEIDLTKDLMLTNDLMYHMKLAIYRLKNNIKIKNSIYKEIENEYPFLFEVIEESFKNLKNIFWKEINKDEIAFFVVHFKMAIDRNYSLNKKRILVVCGQGYGTSKLLRKMISDEFDVKIVDLISYYQLQSYLIKENGIDLVLSTVKISKDLGIPILQVNPILSEKNKKDIISKGIRRININYEKSFYVNKILDIIVENAEIKNKEMLIENLSEFLGENIDNYETVKDRGILKYLPIENIKIMENVNDWEMAIKEAGNILVDHGYVKESYIEDITNTIKRYGMYMVLKNKFLLGLVNFSESIIKTGFSLLVLKKPVQFPENKKIKYIIILSSKDKEEHAFALLELHKIIDKYNLYEKIKNLDSVNRIYEELKKGKIELNK